MSKTIVTLSLLIAVFAAAAAGAGVFGQGEGSPVPFTTLRGETVMLQGHGFYQYDTVSGAAQEVGSDLVTLVLGIPLLLASVVLAARGSLRGKLLLAGTLGYFLYTYASMAFLTAYNLLFLVYVALFSMSLFAFVLIMLSFDLKTLPAHFSRKMPRMPIAVFLFTLAAFLLMAWGGRILQPYLTGAAAPLGLESYTTLVIQTLDLGLIVPTAILTGILLLRRRPGGYLLSAVVLVKGFTMSAAVTAMVISQMVAGTPVSAAEGLMFPVIGLIDAFLMILVLRGVKEAAVDGLPAVSAARA